MLSRSEQHHNKSPPLSCRSGCPEGPNTAGRGQDGGSPGLALRSSGLLPQPAERGRPAPRPPPHGPDHHVAIGAAAGHLLEQLG